MGGGGGVKIEDEEARRGTKRRGMGETVVGNWDFGKSGGAGSDCVTEGESSGMGGRWGVGRSDPGKENRERGEEMRSGKP